MALAKIKCETKRSFCHLWSYESWLGPRCPWIETPVYGRLTFPAKLAGARLQLSQSKNFVHNPQGKAKQQTAWNNNNKTTKSRPVPPLNRMEPGPTVSQQGFNPFTAQACKISERCTDAPANSIFSGPVTHLLSMLYILMTIISHPGANKENNQA